MVAFCLVDQANQEDFANWRGGTEDKPAPLPNRKPSGKQGYLIEPNVPFAVETPRVRAGGARPILPDILPVLTWADKDRAEQQRAADLRASRERSTSYTLGSSSRASTPALKPSPAPSGRKPTPSVGPSRYPSATPRPSASPYPARPQQRPQPRTQNTPRPTPGPSRQPSKSVTAGGRPNTGFMSKEDRRQMKEHKKESGGDYYEVHVHEGGHIDKFNAAWLQREHEEQARAEEDNQLN